MSKGNPIASDLEVLQGFAEPFIVNNVPRDIRMAQRWGVSIKQVYALWNKKRFDKDIEYGVTLRSGWLTPAGEEKLKQLLNERLS